MFWKKSFCLVAAAVLATAVFAEEKPAAAEPPVQKVCPTCGHTLDHVTEPVAAEPCPAVVAAPTTNTWKASVYGGFAAQSGNTVTRSYNYGGEFEKKSQLYRGKLKVDGRYSKTEEQVTVSKSEASGEMRRMLNERWFSYGVLSALHDGLKDVSYRVKAGPGLGYYFIDSKELTADVSSGPLYVQEKKADTASGYLAWRFAQGIDWQITDRFRWWVSTEADVDTTDVAAYIVAFKTGVESKINSNLSLLVIVEDDYDSQPEAKGNIEKNDFEVSTGLRYNF